VLPPDLPRQTAEAAAEALGVAVIRTLINESTLIGSMMTGNSNGFVVSDLALDQEVAALEKCHPVARLKGRMTAAGNIILANDTAALDSTLRLIPTGHLAGDKEYAQGGRQAGNDRGPENGGNGRRGHQ